LKKRKDAVTTLFSKKLKVKSKFANLVKDKDTTQQVAYYVHQDCHEEIYKTHCAQLDVQGMHIKGRAEAKKLKY
jgi:hypothetical protein